MPMETYHRGQTSVILRVKLLDSSSTTGAPLTGLTSASTGLIIGTIANNEATAVAYTVAGSTIETITTLGTYAAPTATKCRFKEVDSTNHKGLYEIQLADARFAVANAKSLVVTISGATNLVQQDVTIPLVDTNPYDASPPYGPKTWFVRTTGSDSNSGTRAEPKLTVAAAITASASGDTIDIGPGTFTGAADMDTANKALHLIGHGPGVTILQNAGTVVTFESGCTVENLTANTTSTANNYAAFYALSKKGITIRNVDGYGYFDGIMMNTCDNFEIDHANMTSSYDAISTPASGNGRIRNSTGVTDSLYSLDVQTRGLYAEGCFNVIVENCNFLSFRGAATAASEKTVAAMVGTGVVFRNVGLDAIVEGVGINSQALCLLNADNAYSDDNYSSIILEGVRFYASNNASGGTAHALLVNATMIDRGSNVDAAKVSGGTFVRQAADVRGWLGTAPATPTTAGVPKVEVPAVDIRAALGMAAADLDTQLDALLTNAGTGARTVTITVNDGSTVLENAIVRMVEGGNAYTATTNASGIATFNLDDATYTVSISKQGYSYSGTTLVVNGTETATYSMTAITISAPADPALTAAYLTTYDAQGAVAGSTVISFKLEDGVGTTGYSYSTSTFTGTSNASTGLLTINLVKSTSYSARRGNGEWVDFTTGSGSTYALPEVLGTP